MQGGWDERLQANGAEHEALRARSGERGEPAQERASPLLNEVVESARALTGARYGAIATIDETGAPRDFVTSGFTDRGAPEHGEMARRAAALRVLPRPSGPLRIADVPAYIRSLGFSPDLLPSKTFQVHADAPPEAEHVGNFYLVEKEPRGGVHGRG